MTESCSRMVLLHAESSQVCLRGFRRLAWTDNFRKCIKPLIHRARLVELHIDENILLDIEKIHREKVERNEERKETHTGHDDVRR